MGDQLAPIVNFILGPRGKKDPSSQHISVVEDPFTSLLAPLTLYLEVCFNSQHFASFLVTKPPYCFLTLSSVFSVHLTSSRCSFHGLSSSALLGVPPHIASLPASPPWSQTPSGCTELPIGTSYSLIHRSP